MALHKCNISAASADVSNSGLHHHVRPQMSVSVDFGDTFCFWLLRHQGPNRTAFFLPDIDSWDKWAEEGTDIRKVGTTEVASGESCCNRTAAGDINLFG